MRDGYMNTKARPHAAPEYLQNKSFWVNIHPVFFWFTIMVNIVQFKSSSVWYYNKIVFDSFVDIKHLSLKLILLAKLI